MDADRDKEKRFAPWLDRYEAVGRAQHRYMYLLAVLVLFFLVVDGVGDLVPATSDFLTIPVVQLDVPRILIQAVAPPITAFLLLAFLGTFAAANVALKGLEDSAPAGLRGDAFDRVPNIIDFAVHTRGKDSKFVQLLAASSYPFFATLALAAVGYLTYRVAGLDSLGSVRWADVVITVGFCIPSVVRLANLWKSKMTRAWKAK